MRSHLFLCLLSYYVQWHLRGALAPLLFDDEDLDAHRARRDPVLKAEPSASAKRKKTKRETEDGLPIHSFKTLMAEMATPRPSPMPNRLGPGRSEAATIDGTDAAAATGAGVGQGVPVDN